MFSYIIGIISFIMVCVAWGLFQIWVGTYNSDRVKSKCSTCDNSTCRSEQSQHIDIHQKPKFTTNNTIQK